MRRRAGLTVIELLVASGILLLMVFMTSTAIVSYVKAYHQYTDRGLRLRQAAKVLEVVCQHLRSAEAVVTERELLARGIVCSEHPLSFRERGLGTVSLQHKDGQLVLEDEQKKATVLGRSAGLRVVEIGEGGSRHLHLRLEVEGNPPLETDVPLRGVR